MISLLTSRRAMQRMSIPTVSAKIIEALGTADTALLRPEGLLTGEPTAVDIRPAGMEAGQFLALAASVMQDCNAPEATAILNAAHSCGITVPSTGHRTASAPSWTENAITLEHQNSCADVGFLHRVPMTFHFPGKQHFCLGWRAVCISG